ncbi:MAG TPA: hypothetical protein VFU55_10105 [Terracidiphilus sp.]|nr:hypothetical protein [Terracidiphilus sp.]
MTRRFETWFAAGLAIWTATFTIFMQLAQMPAWNRMAAVIIH